jgi:hypothetical protein
MTVAVLLPSKARMRGMKRFPTFFLLTTLAACGGATPDSKTAGDVDEDAPKAAGEAPPPEAATTAGPTHDKPAPGSTDDASGAPGVAKKEECNVFDEANLEGVLLKSACEVPNPTGAPPDMSKTLAVTLNVSPAKVTPGGHTSITVTFANKSTAVIPLYFTIDPMPRFEIEVYDAKGNRVDMPKNSPPPLPPGVEPRGPGEQRTARIYLAANGTARMPMTWDAVKMKWAPEKLKGTPPEKGYPRAAAGPLAKGKYTVKVVTPLTNVFEGVDHDVSAPRVQVDVAKL